MERRYFLTKESDTKPLHQKHLNEVKETTKIIKDFCNEIGAEKGFLDSYGNLIAITFKNDECEDRETYRLKGKYGEYERGFQGYYPRKNKEAGRIMLDRFKKLPKKSNLKNAGILELYGAERLHMLEGMTLHQSAIHISKCGKIFFSIPWEDTTLEELKDMKENQGYTDTNMNSRIVLASWIKPENVQEMSYEEVFLYF